jgi:hypothetical protein
MDPDASPSKDHRSSASHATMPPLAPVIAEICQEPSFGFPPMGDTIREEQGTQRQHQSYQDQQNQHKSWDCAWPSGDEGSTNSINANCNRHPEPEGFPRVTTLLQDQA